MWYSCKANSDPLCLEDYPKKEKEKKERERERESRTSCPNPTKPNGLSIDKKTASEKDIYHKGYVNRCT